MVPKPDRSVSRSCSRAALWLAGLCTALAAAGVLTEQGRLRRRVGRMRQMVPGSSIARPVSVVLERHRDGEYHYGLLFRRARRERSTRLSWYSVLDTRLCDRGPISNWQARSGSPAGSELDVVVFLPRSWLVFQGFLPLRAALARREPHRMRDEQLLLESFWLEAYGADGSSTTTGTETSSR